IGLAGCGAPPPAGDGESDSQVNSVIVNEDSAVVGKNATVTASGGLNLRSGPSTSDAVILVMPHGATVAVEATSSGWYKVKYNGTVGWCSGLYLSPDAGGGGSTGGSTEVDKAIARA